MRSGHFIVLEGIDGSGTTSQCAALSDALRARGHRVLETREPSSGPIGRFVRTHLADSARRLPEEALALLFAADRIDHLRGEIGPWLRDGGVVVCDRYLLSSWVYQSLACDLQWVRAINANAPWPDLTLFLEVPVEVALARVHARRAEDHSQRERWDAPALQARLAEGYAGLARDPSLPGIHTIDGTPAPEVITQTLVDRCTTLGL